MEVLKKSLKDISWDVTEEEYRKDPSYSYSTLAKYDREGFNNLDKLFEKVETPSLTFGSAVDSIITGGMQEFEERFIVSDFAELPPESIMKIVKALFDDCEADGLREIADSVIIRYTEQMSYQLNWKPETRAKVIKEKGLLYYSMLRAAEGRTVLDADTYSDVLKAVDALKTSPATSWYFEDNNPFSDIIERFYQLKFKATIDGIRYRCMMDEVIVDHAAKKIYPVDLKTSYKPEWDFYKSFVEWRYHIQARLYSRLLKEAIKNDEYFKDFEVLPYRFIVVNRKTLEPLVWEFKGTHEYGELAFGPNLEYTMKDPFAIATELDYYLTVKPNIPIGIDYELNNIDAKLNEKWT
jgi:hypothetical protein